MANGTGFLKQAGAIPVRGGRICLITSSNGKRWIIPKGTIEPGQTAGEAALQEVWEEAGLVGRLSAQPVGSYLYEKYGRTCHVTVFFMEVTEVAQEWPERDLRERSWVSLTGALDRIEDPTLADLLRAAFRKKAKATARRASLAP